MRGPGLYYRLGAIYQRENRRRLPYFGCRLRSRQGEVIVGSSCREPQAHPVQAGQLVSRILRLTSVCLHRDQGVFLVEPGGGEGGLQKQSRAPDEEVEVHSWYGVLSTVRTCEDPSAHPREGISQPRWAIRGQGNGAEPALDTCCGHLCGPRDNRRQPRAKRIRSLVSQARARQGSCVVVKGKDGRRRVAHGGPRGSWQRLFLGICALPLARRPGNCLNRRVQGTRTLKVAQMTVVSEKLSSQPTCAPTNDK